MDNNNKDLRINPIFFFIIALYIFMLITSLLFYNPIIIYKCDKKNNLIISNATL